MPADTRWLPRTRLLCLLDAFLSPDQPYIPEDLRVSLTFISSKLGRRKKRGTVVSAALNIEFNSSFSLFCSCGFPFGTETRKQNFHIFPAFVEVHARILVNLTFVPCVLHSFFAEATGLYCTNVVRDPFHRKLAADKRNFGLNWIKISQPRIMNRERERARVGN